MLRSWHKLPYQFLQRLHCYPGPYAIGTTWVLSHGISRSLSVIRAFGSLTGTGQLIITGGRLKKAHLVHKVWRGAWPEAVCTWFGCV